HHAQTLEEIELIDRLAAADGEAVASADAAQPLKKHYHAQVSRLRERARFVTRLSSGLLVAVVGLVLAGMMAYFAAIRVWLVRPLESLNDLVQRCADLARPQLTQRGLRLDLALAPALAPVTVDRNKMEQVVSVLLGNAMDASPAGGTIRVISLVRRPNHVPLACIRVEDEGKGIPKDRLGKLFTLFATSKQSGTGP